MIALNQNAAIVLKSGQNRQSGVGIKLVGRIDLWNALVRVVKSFDFHVDVDAEHVADVHVLGRLGVRVYAPKIHVSSLQRRVCALSVTQVPYSDGGCKAKGMVGENAA